VANEVAFEYGPWGAVTKSMQDHDAAATATDPNVQYAYEDGIASNEAKYVRPDYVTYPGPSSRRVVYYNYPTSGVGAALSRLSNIAPISGSHFADYTYLGAGTMVDANYPAVANTPALTYGTRVNSYSGLDRFGRVVDQKWQNQTGGAVKDQFKYGYDRTSNRLYRTNELNHDLDELYHANGPSGAYDGLDRLTDFRRGVLSDTNSDGVPDTVATVSRIQAWSLDPVGNWSTYKEDADGSGWDLDQARLHNKANEIEDTGETPNAISGTPDWIDPAYDKAGNMTAGPQPRYETADANTQLYKYDAWNRLTKIYRDANCNDTIDDPSELVVTYSYDGQNRRIRKVVAGDDTYDYYYNENWQVLEVRKGGDPDPLEQYVWGAQYIDAPVVRFRDGNVDGDLDDTQNNVDSTLYYTYDGNFNVTGLIGTNGTVAERYTYDPYGQVTFKAANWSDAANQAKSAYDNEILYCGYRFDPESGLYQVRYRYLHSTLGKWIARDPIDTLTEHAASPTTPREVNPSGTLLLSQQAAAMHYIDGMNIYQYSGSGPTVVRDPLGLWGADVHHDKTVQWAQEAKYTNKNCQDILANFANSVDWIIGGTAPRPFIGDMSYHFDWDKDGRSPVRNARQGNVDKHLKAARTILDSGKSDWWIMKTALQEIGTALHPLQDMYSHQPRHSADSPMDHAPKAYCTVLLDPGGTKEPWCMAQRKRNPNWSNPNNPDNAATWAADVKLTGEATKKILMQFLSYQNLACRCAPETLTNPE
jgi:RHS repeat-associated protein